MTISVALPVRNGSPYLQAAVASVLAQTDEDFELVVSDNRSTDDTPDVLERFARCDSRVRVSRTETDLPQAVNVNRAVALCSSEWVKLFCHDDLMEPDCLRRLVAAADRARPTVGLLGNGEGWIFGNGFVHQPDAVAEPAQVDGPSFLRSYCSGTSVAPLPSLTTATVRRAAWQETAGFDQRFRHFDVFLWAELLTRWDYCYEPAPLTLNRIHPAQVAVAARRSLESVRDHEVFWPEFVERHGAELRLDRLARRRLRVKPHAAAATYIAIEVMKRRYALAVAMARTRPWRTWPLLAPLVPLAVRRERRRVAPLLEHASLDDIYPG